MVLIFGSLAQMFKNLLLEDFFFNDKLKEYENRMRGVKLDVCTYADPWVLQSLLGSDSLGRVDCQHLVDQIFSLRSHSVPLWGGKLKRKQT